MITIGAGCELWIDDHLAACTTAELEAGKPTALDGLSVTWGRRTQLEQPDIATASIPLRDEIASQDALTYAHVGAGIQVFASGPVPVPEDQVIFGDGGFELVKAGPFPTNRVIKWTGNPTLKVVSGSGPHTGQQALMVGSSGPSALRQFTLSPLPFEAEGGDPTAWDAVPMMAPGEAWPVSVWVKLPWGTTGKLIGAPCVTPYPSGARGLSAATAPEVSANGQWQEIAGTWTNSHTGPAWPLIGLELTLPAALVWSAAPSSWDAHPERWDSYGVAMIDDLIMQGPAYATRRVLVFAGSVTDLNVSPGTRYDTIELELTAADIGAALENDSIGDEPWPVETVQTRANEITSLAHLQVPVIIDETISRTLVSYRDVDAQPVLSLLRDLAQSIGAPLWTATHGTAGSYFWMEDPDTRVSARALGVTQGESILVATNMSPNPSMESGAVSGSQPLGYFSNDGAKYVGALDTTGVFPGSWNSFRETRQPGTTVDATNMIFSPYDKAAVGATATDFGAYESNAGALRLTVDTNQYQGRPVVRIQANGSPTSTRLGVQSGGNAINPINVPAGTTFLFSADLYIDPVLVPGGVNCNPVFRDDANNDSNAATVLSTKAIPVNAGAWTRLEWTATVNAGRTITRCYLDNIPKAGGNVPAGSFALTTRWLVQANGALGAPYFDGSTPSSGPYSYGWTGTLDDSTSQRLTTNNVAGSAYFVPTAVATPGFPCTEGLSTTVSVDIKCSAANRKIQQYCSWLNSAGTIISNQAVYVLADSGPAGTINRTMLTQVAPAGAVSFRFVTNVYPVTGNATVGEQIWWDNLNVGAPSSAPVNDPSYFDGDTPNTNGYSHYWTGEPLTTTSQRWTSNGEIVIQGATREVTIVSASDILRGPVRISQTVNEIVTTVNVVWREQTLDDQGKPSPTERTTSVLDQDAVDQYGRRRLSISTELTTDTDAVDLGNKLLARSRRTNWRADQYTWDTGRVRPELDTIGNDDRQLAIMDLLDGTTRIGKALTLIDLPAWFPTDALSSMYVEGGTYTFEQGAWVLELTVSPAQGQGGSVTWGEIPSSAAWEWRDWAKDIRWIELYGVAGPELITRGI